MYYGTQGEVIEKSSSFGKALTRTGTSGYTFFLITLSWTDTNVSRVYHSYPFVRGYTSRDFCVIKDYWYEIITSNSGNTLNITMRRTNKLANSGVIDSFSYTLEKI